MKIAFLGSRGIPARYSGFETFYEQLATRLVLRRHHVTVYNRSHFIRDVKKEYKGVRIVSLPSIASKHLDTITHTFLSSFHSLFQGYDVVYSCIVGNSPIVWIPRLTGARTLLNVDGEDWAREKWSGFARWYQKKCEWIATKTAQVIISDAMGIKRRYKKLYKAETVFVPYGANIERDEGVEALNKWGLTPREYILYVGRFVPENSVDLLIEAFKKIKTDKKLVVIGDAPYADEYRRHLYDIADDRTIFTGYAFEKDYAQLSSHAYFYVQPSGINGTRPALLDQMGFGNCVLVRNSDVNMEVIGDCGCFFDKEQKLDSLVEKLEELLSEPHKVENFRKKVIKRIEEYYNWEWVTDFYEDLFQRLIRNDKFISYDNFINIEKNGHH
jgi:glycosyltransferase involved in cell wall biosynthesis